MTEKQLFESLQYLDDALLVEAGTAARPKRPALRRAAAAAAGLALIVGAALALSRPGTSSLPASTEAVAGGKANQTEVQRVGVPQPGGVPGTDAKLPDAESAPASLRLVWNEREGAEGDLDADMQVMIVAEPLTAAQLADCAPEIRLEWMDNFEGTASYYLNNGAGGLAWVELRVTRADAGRAYTVRLRDAEAPELPSLYEYQTETDRVGSVGGQEYRAYRLRYWHGEGEPGANPPSEWTELTVIFEKEGVAYTLGASCPAAREEEAAADLADLLLCYAGTHSAPELGAFRCGEHVLIDESLTLEEARADADFGAYLPADGPEGLAFEDARRYRLDESVDYLLALWSGRDGAHRELFWLAEPLDGEAAARLVSPNAPERWDLRLYPAPWTQYAAPEDWLTLEDPVFPAEMLSPEVVTARTREDYDGLDYCNLSVLYDDGTVVRVRARGVSADWLYAALTGIG